MIKNTIIVILLLLLLITFYAYMCLSNNMVDFQKERMQHIVKKEAELKLREQNLVSLTECNQNMNKYKNIIHKISNDLTKTTGEFNNVVKYINQINSSIKTDINVLNGTEALNGAETHPKNEVPKKEEHFENLEINDELDKPIEDGFMTALNI